MPETLEYPHANRSNCDSTCSHEALLHQGTSWQQQGDQGHKQLTSNSDSNLVRSPNVSVHKSREHSSRCAFHIRHSIFTQVVIFEPLSGGPAQSSSFREAKAMCTRLGALRQAARWTRCVPSFWKHVEKSLQSLSINKHHGRIRRGAN